MSTAASLITRVRGKVDEATAAFWTDTVILDQINESIRFYWAFILKNFENYFATTALINWDANPAGLYALPADCMKIRLVSRILQNSSIPLKYFERYDSSMDTGVSFSTYSLPNYRFRGAQILFEPAPSFTEAGAVQIEYIRTLLAMTLADSVDAEFAAIPLAEDCVVLRATCKCKGIEEMVAGGGADIDPFLKDLQSTEQMMKELINQRTQARENVEQFGEDNDIFEHTFL